ncbi:MAG: creatininase family protein [Microcella pacifica]
MVRWQDLTWPEVGRTVSEMPFALLPFGAIEEHGPHLPLGTDALAAGSLASLICDAADIIELPVMPYGQVWSLEHFDGSLSVSDDTLISLVLELAQGLERVGVKGIVLLSAHLGNAAASQEGQSSTRGARWNTRPGNHVSRPLRGCSRSARSAGEPSRDHARR